jgi:hypothetical protein
MTAKGIRDHFPAENNLRHLTTCQSVDTEITTAGDNPHPASHGREQKQKCPLARAFCFDQRLLLHL